MLSPGGIPTSRDHQKEADQVKVRTIAIGAAAAAAAVAALQVLSRRRRAYAPPPALSKQRQAEWENIQPLIDKVTRPAEQQQEEAGDA